MNKYLERKEKARTKAIEWQNEFPKHNYTMSECGEFGEYFKRLAKSFGLVKEFRENGII